MSYRESAGESHASNVSKAIDEHKAGHLPFPHMDSSKLVQGGGKFQGTGGSSGFSKGQDEVGFGKGKTQHG